MAGGKRSRGGQIKKNKEPESTPPPAVKDSVKRRKVLIVANKLPISVERNDQGSWSLNEPVGGLGNALFDVELEGYDTIWIGWPGVSVEDEAGKDALTKALEEKNCVPIFLSKEIVREYYHGFCYKILWPLFHYLGLPQVGVTTKSFQTQFEAYEKANKLFANEINLYYEEGDLVWCHDYHLMFLPQKLKELDSNMKVGWFLHTPFPSSEIPQMLPSISDLLRAVLAADLVGFQTYDCARHFMGACTHILELKGTPDWVADQGRWTRVAAFPIGINSQRFISALQIPEAQDSIKKLREDLSGKKVIFGVDHFDMTKGILQKYLAFEKFLEENEDWREKVVLVQIAIPPKIHVDKYEKLASQVYEMVGRINGRFATYNATPIHHLDRSLDFIDLCEYYAASDVALVTSLRDGMNLVSYEFVACQDSNKGVLILSEFAGASQSLGSGAILVNPWNIAEVAAAIGRALNMPAEERETLHRQNFEHITKHTSQKWAKSFISELEKTKVQEKVEVAPPPQLAVDDAVRRYVKSKHRLLVLGFTDTLTEARGGEKLKLHPGLIEPLKILCKDPNTTIVVLSGCCKNLLGEIFGDYAVWLASENGMFLRPPGGEQDRASRQLMASDTNIEGAIQYFDDRTPGAQFVKRETSLLWDYKHASNAEFGRLQARDLMQHLLTGTVANSYVTVFRGSHSIELRAPGITKGMALVHTLEKMYKSKKQEPVEPVEPVDYVLCLGHFTEEDENIYDIFDPERERDWKGSKLPAFINPLRLKKENYFPCAVGRTRTSAKYSLKSSDDVATLLKAMADAKAASKSPR